MALLLQQLHAVFSCWMSLMVSVGSNFVALIKRMSLTLSCAFKRVAVNDRPQTCVPRRIPLFQTLLTWLGPRLPVAALAMGAQIALAESMPVAPVAKPTLHVLLPQAYPHGSTLPVIGATARYTAVTELFGSGAQQQRAVALWHIDGAAAPALLGTSQGPSWSNALHINAQGTISGYVAQQGGAFASWRAAIWEAVPSAPYLRSQTLHPLPAGTQFSSFAVGANRRGLVVGTIYVPRTDSDGKTKDVSRAALWCDKSAPPVLLPTLPGQAAASQANSINDDGLIGGWASGSKGGTPVVWQVDAACQRIGAARTLSALAGHVSIVLKDGTLFGLTEHAASGRPPHMWLLPPRDRRTSAEHARVQLPLWPPGGASSDGALLGAIGERPSEGKAQVRCADGQVIDASAVANGALPSPHGSTVVTGMTNTGHLQGTTVLGGKTRTFIFTSKACNSQ
ncbi:MAG: hypothetical protein AABZ19_00310 [Pseudomonadota bacterium]